MSVHSDAADLQVIVEEGRKMPGGLTVDAAAGDVYWPNTRDLRANDRSIMRSVLEAGGHEVVRRAIDGSSTIVNTRARGVFAVHRTKVAHRGQERAAFFKTFAGSVETIIEQISNCAPRPEPFSTAPSTPLSQAGR
jgi:hypothetical protein